MLHVVWSVFVCLRVCVLGTWVSCAKAAESIEIPFGADSCGSKEPCIRWGQDWTNPFAAAKGDKMAMRPLPNYFGYCLSSDKLKNSNSIEPSVRQGGKWHSLSWTSSPMQMRPPKRGSGLVHDLRRVRTELVPQLTEHSDHEDQLVHPPCTATHEQHRPVNYYIFLAYSRRSTTQSTKRWYSPKRDRTNLAFADRAFSHVTPAVWNSLPLDIISDLSCLATFKRLVKT